MCPAYENDVIWEGHASMVAEIKHDLSKVVPDAIFCSVGGGGLIGGIMEGCKKEGWDSGIEPRKQNVYLLINYPPCKQCQL
jgi:L-serine/L-threonine ammonia-lyase